MQGCEEATAVRLRCAAVQKGGRAHADGSQGLAVGEKQTAVEGGVVSRRRRIAFDARQRKRASGIMPMAVKGWQLGK